jgi:DNA helicase-2/ATP-dependent DNA helicase PcrA
LNNKKAVDVARFVAMIDRLAALATGPVEEILGHVLAETGYRDNLANSESEEDQERLANIEELLTAARQFDERHAGDAQLGEFLEESSLASDTDAWDAEVDRVTLMTLHASKGLEFPVVHVVALEDGLIPHERSRNEADDLEEERRLLFVGITRAQEELHLSLAQRREFRGQRRITIPSMFLFELPLDELEQREEAWMDPLADVATAREVFDESVHAEDEAAESTAQDAQAGDDSFPFGALETDAHTSEAEVTPEKNTPRPVGPAWHGASLKTAAEMLAGGSAGHEPSPLREEGRVMGSTTAASINSAAELFAELTPQQKVSPESFFQGMLVRHPEYGLGKVVALSGAGPRRTATVAFLSGIGEKKFVVSQSALRPAKGT